MKHLSFRLLILCVLLPPILYILSMQALEEYLHDRFLGEIGNVYLGNTQALLDGRLPLKTAVSQNIRQYLASAMLLSWGLKLDISVSKPNGDLIYPAAFDDTSIYEGKDPTEIAMENFRQLNEGLTLEVNLKVEQLSPLSYGMLLFFILASIGILYVFYRRGLQTEKRKELESRNEISRLEHIEQAFKNTLMDLEVNKSSLESKHQVLIQELEKEREKASSNEEELIHEIVSLEEQIARNLEKQKDQSLEIQALKEELAKFEKQKAKPKGSETTLKRFSVIYKNLSFHEKAIEGFHDLPDNMKIKAEEIISQLDRDPSLVPVKRKVFGKKNRETVLEVIFAYKGRLYYRRLKDGKIEVVILGTKNAQDKDLDFLDRLEKS